MDDPTQQENPKHASEYELDDGYQEPTLDQLAESRYEKAAERRDYVTSGSLTSHVLSKVLRRFAFNSDSATIRRDQQTDSCDQ